jgi:RNA polymerase sigma-70 factor (ECF subfamily)
MPQDDTAVSDRELVDRARTGDRAAFTELVRRYGPRVRRLARQLVRGHADADDVAQEAFVRAHQALPRFDGRSEFFTWIYRIAVNLSLNRARSLAVRRHVDVDDPAIEGALAERPAGPGDPGKALDRQRVARALLDEVDTLPEGLRTTLMLVCVDGVPQEEAAAILGCSAGTVAWRVHEARKRLRERLRGRGLEEAVDELGGDRAKKEKGGAR